MSSTYPTSIIAFTTKTNRVDLVDAAHVNSLQDEVVAIETELGSAVKGTATDLKTRLARSLANNGDLRNGTSFPVTEIGDGTPFYRTDEDTFYVYNGSSWIGTSSTSNLAFSAATMDASDYTANDHGVVVDDSLTAAATSITAIYWGVLSTTEQSVCELKYKKISGVNTVTCYVMAWNSSGTTTTVKVDIGGQSNTATTTSTTPVWLNFNVDVTSLSNGTVYDVNLILKDSSSNRAFACAIVGINS